MMSDKYLNLSESTNTLLILQEQITLPRVLMWHYSETCRPPCCASFSSSGPLWRHVVSSTLLFLHTHFVFFGFIFTVFFFGCLLFTFLSRAYVFLCFFLFWTYTSSSASASTFVASSSFVLLSVISSSALYLSAVCPLLPLLPWFIFFCHVI